MSNPQTPVPPEPAEVPKPERRAYIVRSELEYIIVAESEEVARKLIPKAVRDDQFIDDPSSFDIGPMTHVPDLYREMSDWVEHDGPGDLTVDEASRLPGGYNHKKGLADAH